MVPRATFTSYYGRPIIKSPAVVPMTEQPRRGRIRPLISGLILRSQTDERLALLASAGNQQAFSAIYERYQRELGSHARRIVRLRDGLIESDARQQ